MSTDVIRVAVADAHDAVRAETLAMISRDHTLDVCGEASSGQMALDLVARLGPDALVLDLRMPDIPGIEVVKQIKKTADTTRVLALSSYDDEDYALAAMTAGAAGYLPKTSGADDILNAIHSVVRGELSLRTDAVSKTPSRPGTVQASPEVQRLTDREVEILELVARGLRNRQIADELHLSARTVETHLGHAFTKLKVATRTQALLQAAARGLLVIPLLG